MKITLFISLLIVFGSCTPQSQEVSNNVSTNTNIDTIGIIECDICLYLDSIGQYNAKMYSQLAIAEDTSIINKKINDLNKKLDNLVLTYSHDQESRYQSIHSAHEKCMNLFSFNILNDTMYKESLFIEYLKYKQFNGIPKLIKNFDPSELKTTTQGDYIIKVKGKDVIVSPDEFKIKWAIILNKDSLIENYLRNKKDSISNIIAGKPLSSFSKYETLMFNSHAERFNQPKYNLSLENDSILQSLVKQFEFAMSYK